VEWAEKDVHKEDYVRPALRRMERQHRFWRLLHSQEHGNRANLPLQHAAVCHIERELLRRGVAFRKDDDAFLATDNPQALQAAADRFRAPLIRKRLDYWSWLLGPKFSPKDRQAINLSRRYSIQQVEYCRNLVFRRNFPIHKLFERSCDLGLLRLTPGKITQVFGFRLHKKLRGKLQTVLDKVEHGHHVFRACGKNAVLRMYEKFTTCLRLEVLSNNLRDFGLRKSLDELDSVRQTLGAVTDRFAAFEAGALNVQVDLPLLQRLALAIVRGRSKVAGIKIHDTRMIRLMEVLLHSGAKIGGWRSAEMHQAILTAFGIQAPHYTLNQLRYDLRKMKAHGLLERHGRRCAYCLTDKGNKVALLFILFHKRICGPLANSLFHRAPRPDPPLPRSSKALTAKPRSVDPAPSSTPRRLNSERQTLRSEVQEPSFVR